VGLLEILQYSGVAARQKFRSYDLGVSSFISKPVNFGGMTHVMKTLGAYWVELVELPPNPAGRNDQESAERPH
jgi:hypothetical protein